MKTLVPGSASTHSSHEVATCHPLGTSEFTPGRYVGAEEVEDDGVPFAEKTEGLTRELATQFQESEKLQPAIRSNM